MNLVKTTEQLISKDYPYGFRLKTTKTDYLEFDKKHGLPHCSVKNKPKTGTSKVPSPKPENNVKPEPIKAAIQIII